MLRLVSNIVITQQPTTTYPNRSNVYTLNFVNNVEIKSTWKDLTMVAKLTMPKNVFVKTNQGLVSWVSQDMYANATVDKPPILMRGDRISINLGYYYNPGGGYVTQTNEEFNGFITKINPKMPIEIECEDNMWLLKQAQCPNMVFPAQSTTATYKDFSGATKTVSSFDKKKWCTQNIVTALLGIAKVSASNVYLQQVLTPALAKINVINGVGLSANVETSVGDFRTMNETICQVLFRLRKDYKLDCFFRRDLSKKIDSWNDLYVSGIVYYPKDFLKSDSTFLSTQYDFQKNIVDTTNLIYLRKDDVRLGIKAFSVGKYELTSVNSAGKLKTKSKRLEVSVGDTDGDIRTQFFWPATNKDPDLDLKQLKILAEQRLNKLKYEGWRGNFSSFGLPYVQHGQAVTLKDEVIPERTGTYLVKGVIVRFGMGGFRREIEPHIRIDKVSGLNISDMVNGL